MLEDVVLISVGWFRTCHFFSIGACRVRFCVFGEQMRFRHRHDDGLSRTLIFVGTVTKLNANGDNVGVQRRDGQLRALQEVVGMEAILSRLTRFARMASLVQAIVC